MKEINYERFLNYFKELKSMFPNEGGNNGYNRLAFSEREKQTHNWLGKKLKASGISVKNDSVGNTFGRIGSNGGPAIGIGSHIDTVPHGGLYDGAYGTLAALEVIRTLADNNVNLKNDVLFTCFVGEEVNPLGGTFGSRAMVGKVDTEKNKYFSKEQLKNVIIPHNKYKNFLELHIEQSSSLEKQNITIGVPTAIAGIVRYEYIFIGKSLHAGATLMKYREDALVFASHFIKKVFETACKEEETKQLVATVGRIKVYPNTPTVIPSNVNLILEIRATNMENAYNFHKEINEWLNSNNFNFSDNKIVDKESGILSHDVDKIIEQVSSNLKYSYKEMYSGANHDVNAISKFCKAGLIFVPSHEGISHSPEEFTSKKDLIAGLNVLYETIIKLAS